MKQINILRLTVLLALFIISCTGTTLTDKSIEGDLEPVEPVGWTVGGTAGMSSSDFEFYIDKTNKVGGNQGAVFLSTKADRKGMGTLHQTIAADSFVGARVRLSGYIKTNMVSEWAGLWL